MPEEPPPLPLPHPCAQSTTIDAHGRAIDAAHGRLREHDSQLASLTAQTTHGLERLARVEAANSDNHRLLVALEANVEGLGSLVRGVATTSEATHAMLQGHIVDNTRVTERQTRRLIKIAGALGALVALLGALATTLADLPLGALFGGAP